MLLKWIIHFMQTTYNKNYVIKFIPISIFVNVDTSIQGAIKSPKENSIIINYA